eukprot:TRINITY_DN781839_c0_g1_i1.p1 TRINITY_DN781839_c0_g1~~TRINITY_DN781839_c0_g1_i1.p1  ORF type:complete len:210 (-),score=64.77 TRINITY_DN781839_c0_g1_i1:256-885(-)
MYTTKSFNPKALKAEQFTSIGDPYVKKAQPLARHTKKQFQTIPPKGGQTEGYFSKINYKPEPYVDSNLYIKKQPLDSRKNGFGSKDCSKRDEFTLHIRTEQYRELLKGETKKMKSPGETMRFTQDMNKTQPSRPESKLFDIGRSVVTDFCPKCSRETWHCPHKTQQVEKKLGGASLTSQEFGYDCGEVAKPGFGRKSETKSFYDRSHLS